MIGCGGHLGDDGSVFQVINDYDGKGKGSYVRINGKLDSSTDMGPFDGLAKRPLFVFSSGGTTEGAVFSKAGFRLPILHYFLHYCVSLIGGDIPCGPYEGKCDASAAINMKPLSVAASALGIGKNLANNLGVFSTGLAMGLMFVIWFGNWLTMIIQERFTPEAFIKGCLMLIIGVLVINKATYIADAFISTFGGGGGGGGETSTDVSKFTAELKPSYNYLAAGLNVPIAQIGVPLFYVFIDGIGTPIMGIIGAIIILLAQIQCAVALASALIPAGIEISLRIQAAPVMFALSTQTGWGQPMISYLKGCVAAGVTPALIMAVVNNVGDINFFNFSGIIPSAIGLAISYKIVAGFIGQISGIVHQVISH